MSNRRYVIIVGCLEDGEIDLFGIHNSSKIISLNGAGNCKNTDVHQDPKKQYYIIPSTCADNTTIRVSLHLLLQVPERVFINSIQQSLLHVHVYL